MESVEVLSIEIVNLVVLNEIITKPLGQRWVLVWINNYKYNQKTG